MDVITRLGHGCAVKISVVIPAFNEEQLLPTTLASIRTAVESFTARGWETEIIVCDNNSTDRTAAIARDAGATVIFEPVNQIGRARNSGAAAATGDWLLFVDADSHPTVALLADTAAAIASGNAIAGGSTIHLDSEHRPAKIVTALWNRVSRWRRLLAGSFIFVDQAAFREIGGFSHEYFAGEELDFAKRLHALARRSGKAVVILDKHPLLTSDRKARLYSPWEHLKFMLRAGLRPRATLRNREACHTWYDGRR